MTMGQRILRARQEMGLSQRQLAGEEMTRNMLSALEHDTANPSVATLRYLSEKLCKPISYFLGENVLSGEAVARMEQARAAWAQRQYGLCLRLLEEPLEEYAQERQLLRCLSLLELARKAREEERLPYARQLLEQCETESMGCLYGQVLGQQLQVLLGRPVDVDDSLLGNARCALADGRPEQALLQLQAMQGGSEERERLTGEALLRMGQYEQAAAHFLRCRADRQTFSRLEICYRELGDYKQAYYYATQNR